MIVKPYLHRSISDLEWSVKHQVMRHRGQHADVWMELNRLLHDQETLYAYCDCSVKSGCFHVGICIVGLNTCRLYGTSVGTQVPQYTILGELYALRFAIGCVRDFLSVNAAGREIQSIYIYSDVDHIEQLLRVNSHKAHVSIRQSVRRLRHSVKRFNTQSKGLALSVRYLGKPNDINLYYKIAHRAARRVAGIRK